MAFRRAVNDPNVVASASHVVAHFLESGSPEKARHCDEANNPCVVCRVMVKDLPCRPTPEVDIEIAEVLAVRSGAPFCRRHPSFERWWVLRIRASIPDPAATTHRLLLVRWIAENDGDGLLAFDLVRIAPGASKGSKHTRKIV